MRVRRALISIVFFAASAAGAAPAGELDPATRALLEAAFDGNTEGVKRLVETGTDVDAKDPEDHTALMWAAFNGHTGLVRYLLYQGAGLEVKDKFGRTSLMYACSGPNDETVKLLLERGASPYQADKVEKFTALMFAAAEGQIEVVRLLLKHGADPAAKDADGDTAASMAEGNGHAAVVALLQSASP
jgi:ankyrin repeat protein